MNSKKAANLMEDFILSGHYSHMKLLEEQVKNLNKRMEKHLEQSDHKRHVFEQYGIVGRFVAKKLYDVDYLALNEYLYNIGLLCHVVEVQEKDIKQNELVDALFEPFQLEPSYFIKPNFNKLGKETNKAQVSFVIDNNWSLNEMAKNISLLKPQLKQMKKMYSQLRQEILLTNDVKKLLKKKKSIKPIPHQFGSISILQKPIKYDVPQIYEAFGEGFLLDYGKPNAELLNQYMMRGSISKNEINQFKNLKDIRLDFVVMTLEDEQQMLKIVDQQQMTAAKNRRRA